MASENQYPFTVERVTAVVSGTEEVQPRKAPSSREMIIILKILLTAPLDGARPLGKTACMKSLLLALLLLPSTTLAFENPPEPCGGMNCPPRLLEIAEGFTHAGPIDASALPLLASGECHHLSADYNSSTTHYGMILLDPKDGQVFMGGRFGFFFPENPYKDLDLEKARAESTNLYADNHRVELTEQFAFSDMNPGRIPIWWYWLKRSGEKIFVMGHWGVYHRFLCEMTIHSRTSGGKQ